MTSITIALAVVFGAAWRRWWGNERPPWALSGYRAMQAVAGFLVCAILAKLSGDGWIKAAIVSGLALAFLSFCAQSVPHLWKFWDEIETRFGLPRIPGLDGGAHHSTCWAEASAGALIWGIAVAL